MLKFLNSKLIASAVVGFSILALNSSAFAGDAKKGEKVFKKCKACHAVGEGAKNKVGPQLNNIMGRKIGSVDGAKYSKEMKAAGEAGDVWDEANLAAFLKKPKDMFKKTKMSFAGLRKDKDIENVLAYLATYSEGAAKEEATEKKPAEEGATEEKAEGEAKTEVAAASGAAKAVIGEPSKGKFKLGRLATKEEVAAWDIDVRPDGLGLPDGKGTVAQGEVLYVEQCAVCHGDFGEAVDRWPVLSGGQGTLTDDRPVKTVGSYWPYLSTVFDYVRRSMPFTAPRSLSDDDVYAITAYLLYLNDIVEDEEFELSKDSFKDIKMPNADNFKEDGREKEVQYAEKKEPCMKDCKPGKVEITMRARVLDVTPDGDGEEGAAGIE